MTSSSASDPAPKVGFTPWTQPYFARRAASAEALLAAPATSDVEGYEIVGAAEGGMADVLIGRRDGELFALKTLKAADGAGGAALENLADEAARHVRLDSLYHLYLEDILSIPGEGRFLMVLPYCAGGSLHDRAAHGDIPIEELAYYGMALAAELKALHDKGILHLDLKPSNILLDRARSENAYFTWRTLVSDFGLSRIRTPGRPITSASGTPLFMAPEQFLGQPLDAPTDVWGYGALLYFLITGTSPLESVWPLTPQTMSTGAVSPPSTLSPWCPPWLDQIVAGCLELVPSRRPRLEQVFDAFLRSVRVTSDREKDGTLYAGPPEGDAAVVISDRFLLTCASKMRRVDGNIFVSINLGWVGKFRDAQKLHSTSRPGATRRALSLLDEFMGSWDDPTSLLGRFAAEPNRVAFAFDAAEEPPLESGDTRSINPAMPLGMVWNSLSLRCSCLTDLAEDLGRPDDIAALKEACERWLATNSLGAPPNTHGDVVPRAVSLCTIAKGLRLAGDYERAFGLLLEALKQQPDNLTVIGTIAHVFVEVGEYKLADEYIERALGAADRAGRSEVFAHFLMLGASVFVRRGNIEAGVRSYQQLYARMRSPELLNFMHQAVARKNKRAAVGAADAARKRAVGRTSVDSLLAIAELAHWSGERELADRLLKGLLRDPRLLLPSRKYQREVAQALVGS